MRILVLLHDAFGGHGGIAKFNRDLLTALTLVPGCSEVVALPRDSRVDPGPLPAGLTWRSGAPGRIAYVLRLFRLSLSGGSFDLVVCGHINLLPLASPLARRLATPILLIVHGIDAWQPTGRFLTDAAARRVEAFAAVSRFTAERFRAWTGRPESCGHLIPNCVDLAAFAPGPPRSDLLDRYGLTGKRVVMTLSRLPGRERHKGVDEVIELMPDLRREMPDLVYLVAGDGEDRARLEAKARALGVGEAVIFAGYIAEEEKADHYRLADAFVLCGRGEGFGIVLLEAMACGIPVVASSRDASREAVAEGALGELADPDDSNALGAAIRTALGRPRGVVQEGLSAFDCRHFPARVAKIVSGVLSRPR